MTNRKEVMPYNKTNKNMSIATKTNQNLPSKLGQQSIICRNSPSLTLLGYGLKYIFLGIKLFAFQDKKLKLSTSAWKRISWNLTKFQLIQHIQTIFIFINLSVVCLIELKFCEVSWNSLPDGVCCPNFQWRFCYLASFFLTGRSFGS